MRILRELPLSEHIVIEIHEVAAGFYPALSSILAGLASLGAGAAPGSGASPERSQMEGVELPNLDGVDQCKSLHGRAIIAAERYPAPKSC